MVWRLGSLGILVKTFVPSLTSPSMCLVCLLGWGWEQCLALRLVVPGMGSFRDEPQVVGPTDWDLVGRHAATTGT